MSAHLTQLFSLLYSERKIEELLKAVDQTRDRMEKAGEGNIWKTWRVIALSSRGDFVEAEAVIETISGDFATEAKRVLITERARQTKDWQAVIEFLEEQWIKTGAAGDLLALCEIHLESGTPQFIADHAHELVERIATPAALRLALAGAARAENRSLCLELLQKFAGLFPDGKLPTDLRRLRISCEESLGLLGEAAKDAEELVREEASAENLSVLFRVRVAAGDLKAAIFPARELVHSKKTPTHILVQIASVMRLEDKALATKALEEAAARDNIDPAPLGLATITAAQLNLEELLRQFIPKMATEAAKEGAIFRTASLSEMLEMHRIGQEQFARAIEEWRHGKIPIHLLRRWTNLPLASWSALALSNSSSEGRISSAGPLFFRHGARGSNLPDNRGITKLYVDITALHIGFQLGILPLVEKHYGPLFLPPAARRSLVQQADDSNRNQPNLVEAHHAVAQLLDSGRIEVWPPPKITVEEAIGSESLPGIWWKELNEAARRGGLLVDYWPKLRRDNPPFEPSGEILAHVTSAAQILKVLAREGRIENHQVLKASEGLTAISQTVSELPLPKLGQPLLLQGNIAEQLASFGILDATSAAFRLVMTEPDVIALRVEVSRHKSWQRVSEHLRELREYILASAHYHTIVLKDVVPSKSNLKFEDPAEECLTELLQAEPGEGRFVWIDDRNISGFQGCGKVPIITTLELINELLRTQKIGQEQYHAILHKLRTSDFRYIPVTREEIIYHLNHASTQGGRIIETPELAALRQYFARILLDNSALQFPPVEALNPNKMGETQIVMGLFHATSEALITIFTEDSSNPLETQFAQADWILANLWLEPGHLAPALGRPIPQNEHTAKLLGIGDSLLVHRAIGSRRLNGNQRKHYFQWLENRVFADESRAKNVAKHVSRTLEGKFWRRGKNATERKIYAAIMSDWFVALPEKISRGVTLSGKTRQVLGISNQSTITIDDLQFDSKNFWKAVESAYCGTPRSIDSLDDTQKFDVALVLENTPRILTLTQKGTPKSLRIQADVLSLLEPTKKERIEFLKMHPEWFDGFGNKAITEIQRVADIKSFTDRVFAVEAAKKTSAWHYYANLQAICLSKTGPNLEQMAPPEPFVLAAYLRLPGRFKANKISELFEGIATKLLSEVGLAQAFARLATLPRELPNPLVECFKRLSSNDKRNFVNEVNSRFGTPLLQLHLLYLILQGGKDFQQEATKLASALLSDDQVREMSALLRVVSWSWSQLKLESNQDDTAGVRHLVMSWTHGSHLFGMLRKISDAETIFGFMRRYGPLTRSPRELIVRMHGEDDCVFPHKVQPNVLLVTGVGLALHRANQMANELDPSLIPMARNLCFHERDSIQLPQTGWMSVPGLMPDAIGSFLGIDRQIVLTPLLGSDLTMALSTERMITEIGNLLSALEENPNQDSVWLLLGAFLMTQKCPYPFQERLKKLIESIDWNKLILIEQARTIVTIALATQAWSAGGADFAEQMRLKIIENARLFSHSDETGLNRQARSILLSVEALARQAPPQNASHIFSSALASCIDVWPDLASQIPGLLQLLGLPDDQLVNIWPCILRARHFAKARKAPTEDEDSESLF